MGKMQATYDDVALDNGSYRFVTGTYGDTKGLNANRIIAVDFYIIADTSAELEQRKAEVEAEFEKINARFTLTLDDEGGQYYADISPNDGKHDSVACYVEPTSEKAQTGHRLNMRLICVAGVTLKNAGTGNVGQPQWDGLTGEITYGTDRTAARIVGYRFLATFVATFDDDANGPYTIASVASAGGKARFTLVEEPVEFIEGMRLKVSAGSGYLGLHVITAINTGAKTVTTATPYVADATGTAYIGEVTTGEENYLAARDDILTDYLHCDDDGGRDPGDPSAMPDPIPSTGMALSGEIADTKDKDGNTYTVFLQSKYMSRPLPSLPEARGLELRIRPTEPERWPSDGGPKPLYLDVSGSVPVSIEALQDRKLYSVWQAGLKTDIENAVLDQTGEPFVRPLFTSFRLSEGESVILFECRYQARNSQNIDYSVTTVVRPEDDRVRAQEASDEGFHYDQRPPGPKPTTVTVTATRTGIGNSPPFIPVPASDEEGAFYDPLPPIDTFTPFGAEFASDMYVRSRAQTFLLTKYRDGGAGGGDSLGDIVESDLADAQAASDFSGDNDSLSGI